MIVVIGSPTGRSGSRGVEASGLGTEIARAIAAAGGEVQVVGRVGEDDVGDLVLLDLAARGVGHVAVLRTAGAATRVSPTTAEVDDGTPGGAAAVAEPDERIASPGDGLALDAPDLELALRYLPEYRVIVATPGLDAAALETVVAAATWSAARLIVVAHQADAAPDLPADVTVLEPPGEDAAFATVVARYAIELDRGTEPAAAFEAASTGSGWTAVSD